MCGAWKLQCCVHAFPLSCTRQTQHNATNNTTHAKQTQPQPSPPKGAVIGMSLIDSLGRRRLLAVGFLGVGVMAFCALFVVQALDVAQV